MNSGSSSAGKPRVLLAARPIACVPLREALAGDAELVEAHTLEAAVAELERAEPIRLVVCTVYFDESRMFDLLKWARARCAHIPFVCTRALPKDLPRISIEAIRIAADSLGAALFVDVPELARLHGPVEAAAHLRRALLGQIAA